MNTKPVDTDPDPLTVMHCIAIGDGAVADKPYELCIKTRDFELRGIMSPDEFLVLSALLRRMIENSPLCKV